MPLKARTAAVRLTKNKFCAYGDSGSHATMIAKDNDGKAMAFIETMISNERVVTINATRQVAIITNRDRSKG